MQYTVLLCRISKQPILFHYSKNTALYKLFGYSKIKHMSHLQYDILHCHAQLAEPEPKKNPIKDRAPYFEQKRNASNRNVLYRDTIRTMYRKFSITKRIVQAQLFYTVINE